MNPAVRTLILWIAIFVVVIVLWNTFQAGRVNRVELSFTEFLEEVADSRVADVTIRGQEITGTFAEGGARAEGDEFRTFAPEYPELVAINNSEIYHEGAWKSPKELFTPDMFKKVLTEMMRLSPEETAQLDDIPLNEWVDTVSKEPGIRLLFFYLGCATSVGNRFETYSTGEMIYILKEIVEAGRKLSEIGGVIKGGMNSILQPLADYINSHNGEDRLNAPVESVAFKDGQATGVNVEVGERLFHSQVLDVETIKADFVVVVYDRVMDYRLSGFGPGTGIHRFDGWKSVFPESNRREQSLGIRHR